MNGTLAHRITTLRDRVANTPGLRRDTIAVVIALFAGLVCGGYILQHQHMTAPWTKKFTFAAEFTEASGVRPQAVEEVRIAGVTVGRITGAEPQADGNAKLTMAIDPDQTVYSNAQLTLRTKSPLNIMYVELNPGGAPGTPIQSGATIPVSKTERAVQPYELLDKLNDHTRVALTSLLDQASVALRTAPSDLPKSLDATHTTMREWQPIIDQLVARRQHISRLVSTFATLAKASGADGQRVQVMLTSMRRTLDALGSRDTQLSQTLRTLPGFTRDLSTSMTKVTRLTRQLNPTLSELDNASGKLPDAIDKLTGSVGAIHNFVNGAAPVVDLAGPIVNNLKVFSYQANPALQYLRPVAGYLPSAARRITPWMGDLAAFTYQTSSSFSLYDVNGGLGRANVVVDLTNPSGGLAPIDGNSGVKHSSTNRDHR